ncbi:uncharacterized protein DS421_8g242350 [Arachis hypogaea]|nr:uncharacterized protein DS421_8g242350 [Arachis hypogaea]
MRRYSGTDRARYNNSASCLGFPHVGSSICLIGPTGSQVCGFHFPLAVTQLLLMLIMCGEGVYVARRRVTKRAWRTVNFGHMFMVWYVRMIDKMGEGVLSLVFYIGAAIYTLSIGIKLVLRSGIHGLRTGKIRIEIFLTIK